MEQSVASCRDHKQTPLHDHRRYGKPATQRIQTSRLCRPQPYFVHNPTFAKGGALAPITSWFSSPPARHSLASYDCNTNAMDCRSLQGEHPRKVYRIFSLCRDIGGPGESGAVDIGKERV